MEFYLKDDQGNISATFEYLTSTKDCKECKAIIVKKGSYLSKNAYCSEKWLDCKWVQTGREELIANNIVEDFNDEYYVFKEDMVYNSPTKAISIVLGHNEKDAWNIISNKKGKTLHQVYRF